MTNISNTKKDIKEILTRVGLNKIEDLFNIVPSKFKYDYNKLSVGSSLSEFDLEKLLEKISSINKNSSNALCFMGGGSYDHYIPEVVNTLSSRSEFYTAYTPYQPEVSQGTLQYLYEFQTMLCNLTGMEVANASLYDCASAIAEACSMSISITKKNKILLSSLLHPSYIDVIKTYFKELDVSIELINNNNSITEKNEIKKHMDDSIACIVLQSPNYYGIVEDIEQASKYKGNSLLVCVSDPISISILKSPGDCGADIYVGEGQPLGNYISFGGPYIGLFATKLKYARKMPGRIIGKTIDINNNDGFVMTLQTREQHIRREKATSNICTNQGLLALRCAIYLALLGKKGIPGIAKMCYDNSHYAASKIKAINSFTILNDNYNFIKEFIIKTKYSASMIQKKALERNILIDKPLNDKSDQLILLAFTEKRSKEEIDYLVKFLSSFK